MTFRTVFLSCTVLATAALPVAAQDTTLTGPGRVFRVRHWSWWAADGLPAADVVARDSTFVFRPDSAPGWPATGTVPAAFEITELRELPVTLLVRPRAGIEQVLVSAEEAGCGEEWAGGTTSALGVLALAFLVPVDSLGEDERPLPTLTFGACDDTVVTTLSRWLGPWPLDSARRSRFVSVNGSVNAVWRAERELVPGGITVRASLRGSVSGTARVTSDGVMDDLDLSGRFRGVLVYDGPAGRADTVFGTWVTELAGGWVEDPRICWEREFEYFTRHGRGMGCAADDSVPDPYLALADRARDDSTVIDSLVTLRVAAANPKERARLDEAIVQAAAWGSRSHAARAMFSAPVRIAPDMALHLAKYEPDREYAAPLDMDVARALVRELAPLAVQRRRLTDRPELLSSVVSLLGDGFGFVPEAGPLFTAAAREADDALTRDLLLLAAYQADPARYRGLLVSTADSVRGYGPIGVAWARGNGSLTHWSWGVERARLDSLTWFPGVDATPESLRDYLSNAGFGRHRLAALEMRFRADGRDLLRELRHRFERDTTFGARHVLVQYLAALRDTSANPWLRTQLAGPEDARTLAYGHLPRDTVRDTTVIADVQRMVLGYIVGMEPIPDTTGSPVDEPWVHDERPDLRILASEGVLETAIQPWRRHFLVMTLDSVQARVATDGLQMAWTVSPLLRTGDRYYVSVTLSPVGGMCLCGGGVNFGLERRGGQWVAVSVGRWIS